MNQYTDFFWKLAQNILAASLPILAAALTAWLVQKIREMGKRINADTMDSIRIAVGIAVDAAEQAGAADLIADAYDKKTYAIDLAQEFLNKQGIKVDVTLLEGLVEAAVISAFPHDNVPVSGVITTTTTTTAPSGDVGPGVQEIPQAGI